MESYTHRYSLTAADMDTRYRMTNLQEVDKLA